MHRKFTAINEGFLKRILLKRIAIKDKNLVKMFFLHKKSFKRMLKVKYYKLMLYLAIEPMPVNGSQPTDAVKLTFLPAVMSRNDNIL